jgi:hypothetical protein
LRFPTVQRQGQVCAFIISHNDLSSVAQVYRFGKGIVAELNV